MTSATRIDHVRAAYARFQDHRDPSSSAYGEGVVFHIAGAHPLSGDHVGVEAVTSYLARISAVSSDHSGFTITSIFTDETGDLVLVEGTAYHGGEEPFVRTIVHLLRFSHGKLVEFWDNPFDQPAEDAFWRARIPAQRDRRSQRPGGVGLQPAPPAQRSLR
jgi:hypothetical protein